MQELYGGRGLEWFHTNATMPGLPRIPPLVLTQMSARDWGDLERILSVSQAEMDHGSLIGDRAVTRAKGRGRLMVDYLQQRLVRLDNGTLAPVPELYPRLFEEADLLENLRVSPVQPRCRAAAKRGDTLSPPGRMASSHVTPLTSTRTNPNPRNSRPS